MRTLRLLRDLITYGQIHTGTLDSRVEVEWLVYVVTGLVITLNFPIKLHFLAIKIGIHSLKSFFDIQSWNALQNEEYWSLRTK